MQPWKKRLSAGRATALSLPFVLIPALIWSVCYKLKSGTLTSLHLGHTHSTGMYLDWTFNYANLTWSSFCFCVCKTSISSDHLGCKKTKKNPSSCCLPDPQRHSFWSLGLISRRPHQLKCQRFPLCLYLTSFPFFRTSCLFSSRVFLFSPPAPRWPRAHAFSPEISSLFCILDYALSLFTPLPRV